MQNMIFFCLLLCNHTCRNVLYNSSSSCVIDNISTFTEVMQVITTIKTSVAKHMLQREILQHSTRQQFTEGVMVKYTNTLCKGRYYK